jgi:phosphatidate cytidylyltransferase
LNKLVKRTLVGAVLVAIVVAAVFLPPLAVTVLVLVWVFMASREYTVLFQRQGVAMPHLLIPAINLALPLLLAIGFTVFGPGASRRLLPMLFLPLALIVLNALTTPPPRGPRLLCAVFGTMYLSLLPSYLILLRYVPGIRPALVLYPLIATWINDTGALAIGRWLGRHKLAPDISPNKTWEGFLAGLVATVVFSVLYLRRFLPGVPPGHGIALGLMLGIVAQAGDLVESIFKREAAVKDSSTALSEHGGFLDRADSLLFTIPVFYYYLTAIGRFGS